MLVGFCKIMKAGFHDWHFKKVLNYSNFLKLLFIYAFALLWVIIIEIDYSDNFWRALLQGQALQNQKRFSFYSVSERIGESLIYDRIHRLADKQGYVYSGLKFSEALSHFWLTAHLYRTGSSIINYLFKPVFNLALTHHVAILPAGYNLTYLNIPPDGLFDVYGEFLPQWKHLNDYDGYVDLYSFVHGDNQLLTNLVNKATVKSGSVKQIIPMYLAQIATDYKDREVKQALITGTMWGCNRGSLRILMALKKLANDGLLVGIGMKRYLGFLDEAYLGRIEDFGLAVDALDELQKKYGIALIVHNQEHMLEGIPTSRIVEAASNGALIIADQNLFLLKFFGDAVLYFDAFAPCDQIYQTIKEHILWARNHPQQVWVKTRKAWQIFMNHFTMDRQLDKLFFMWYKKALVYI